MESGRKEDGTTGKGIGFRRKGSEKGSPRGFPLHRHAHSFEIVAFPLFLNPSSLTIATTVSILAMDLQCYLLTDVPRRADTPNQNFITLLEVGILKAVLRMACSFPVDFAIDTSFNIDTVDHYIRFE